MTTIRQATKPDVPGLATISEHYVLFSHCTFDTVPPTHDEVRRWAGQCAEGTPYRLQVTLSGAVPVGYAATMRCRPKPAFDGTVEVSIWPAWRCRNHQSLAVHRKHGFVEVGPFVD